MQLGQHFTDMKGSKYMLVHSLPMYLYSIPGLGNFNLTPLASKYARFVVLGRLMYWTPPPDQTIVPPLLKF